MRSRLMKGFDRFVDVREKSDAEIASMLKAMEIDIAVDLKGFTQDARPGIFALRPAPLQVNYLGHPGTMGAPYIDYIVADAVVIPPGDERHCSEKVVRLPHSYQANDSRRRIAEPVPSRFEAGLPDTGFVFCSFNSSYKITPELFDIWMHLIKTVQNSVLWLLDDNPAAVRHLKREAETRGVASSRLIFAPRANPDAHLARHAAADLFLDTLPCNAHTTASDALWAGLPLVTSTGTTFAGRVAASLLTAVGLPELITRSLEEYESTAMKLAQTPVALSQIRAKLQAARKSSPLFKTERFTRDLEAAFAEMWRRHQSGMKPESFAVSAAAN
jgi:predicted O-linked N-acetylglucosamine transferase (SPINDLY family)